MSQPKNIYTIPAGIPFSEAIARKLFDAHQNEPEALSTIRILLPTRRACRVLRDSFLKISNGKPVLLPRLHPIGDVDEEELSLSIAGHSGLDTSINLLPGMPTLKRQILLAKTIMAAPNFAQGYDHALALAASLGQLMDQIYTENLSLDTLNTLVPDEFAQHWQITIDFLKILSEHWPKILAEYGMIDMADRRNRLILALSEHWQNNPPTTPVIAAGSTGSIPATAQLLSTIAAMPQGQIILPGLDQDIDQQSWDALEESHPQFGFKSLLSDMETDRKDVRQWQIDNNHQEHAHARRQLANELMRPAETTASWRTLQHNPEQSAALKDALSNIKRFECTHEEEEAQTIALILREALETPGKTAALITPDRYLARRVTAECKRWNIKIDDSAGQSLSQTPLGVFLKLSIQLCLEDVSPYALLALLKHSYCCDIPPHALEVLEIKALRGLRPSNGFDGIIKRLHSEENTQDAIELIEKLQNTYTPMMALRNGSHDAKRIIDEHITLCEALSDQNLLWGGDAGETATIFIAELREEVDLIGTLSLKDYHDIFEKFLKTIPIRPSYGTHPRLMILGQLEARLIATDLVILSSLNEGTWPPDSGHDPWMSRPMRKKFGLPSPERSLGLAAHDFVQGFCANDIVLTRSKRASGTPTVPARWLQRLDTVVKAANIPHDQTLNFPHQFWARTLDQHSEEAPYTRPAPTPPLEHRPRKLPATRIETWLKDPYAIYARYILKLRKTDPLEQDTDAAMRGTILHKILERFTNDYPDEIPKDAKAILHRYAEEEIRTQGQSEESLWHFWWPRFDRISTWLINHEQKWRRTARLGLTEIEGQCELALSQNTFTLTAKADRIDILEGSAAAIIDYKSGGSYSKKAIKSGDQPQLSVGAFIASKNGFDGMPNTVSSLSYWVITGGSTPGKVVEINANLEEIIARTGDGILTLAQTFCDPETPYYSLPQPARAPRFNDYEHLARVKEWTALGDSEESSGTEGS